VIQLGIWSFKGGIEMRKNFHNSKSLDGVTEVLGRVETHNISCETDGGGHLGIGKLSAVVSTTKSLEEESNSTQIKSNSNTPTKRTIDPEENLQNKKQKFEVIVKPEEGILLIRQTNTILVDPFDKDSFQVIITFKEEMTTLLFYAGYHYYTIAQHIYSLYGILPREYNIFANGKFFDQTTKITALTFIKINLKVLGGSRSRYSAEPINFCATCGGKGHSALKCWRTHPELRPSNRPIKPDHFYNADVQRFANHQSNGKSKRKVTMDEKAKNIAKRIIAQTEWSDSDSEKIESFEKYHSDEMDELYWEQKQKDISVSKDESNYDSSGLNSTKPLTFKQKEKVKVGDFQTKAKRAFVNSPGNVKEIAESLCFNTKQPESKLKMAGSIDLNMISSSQNLYQEVPDQRGYYKLGEKPLDPFELLEFEYELPGRFFRLFKTVTLNRGYLPRFACQYLNCTSSMPCSAVNMRNTLTLLFKETETRQHVANMINKDLLKFYEMTLAYYSSIQHDSVVSKSCKILGMHNSSRKINVDALKNDSPFGVNFENVCSTIKGAVQIKLDYFAKRILEKIEDSTLPDNVDAWLKKAENYVFDKKKDNSDDDFDDMDNNSKMIHFGGIAGYPTIAHVDVEPEVDNKGKEEMDSDPKLNVNSMKDENYFEVDQVVNDLFREQHDFKIDSFFKNVDGALKLDVDAIEAGDTESINASTDSIESNLLLKSEPVLVVKGKSKKSKQKKSNKKTSLLAKNVRDNKMAIFPSSPKASAIIEEIVKQFVPYGATIVGKIDDWVHQSKHRQLWHKKSMKYKFFDRLDMHIEHNRMETFDLANHYEVFSKGSDIMPDCIASEMNNLSDGFAMSSVPLPIINKEIAEGYPYPHVGKPEGALELKTELQKFYPLFYAINNFVSYGNTNENFVAAVLCRLLYPKTNGPKPGVWRKIIDEIQIFPFDFVPDFEAWFSELTAHQKSQVKRHLEAGENGDKIDTETKVFLKMKELLKKSSKGYGRLIFNVSTKYLYLLGDFLAQFSKAMVASLFPPTPTFTISDIACFHYASKFSDVDMNKFVNIAMLSTRGKFVLVLGDDTMIIDRDLGKFVEVDFTAYDSTQVRGGGLDLFPELLRKMGCVDQADAYENMYAEKLNWQHKKSGEKIQMPDEWIRSPSRMSGEPGTSVANSYTTIMATKAVLEGRATYNDLGLVAKTKVSTKLDTTFLKGTWLYSHCADKWYWTRLPSFILKLKSFTEPKTVYKAFSVQKAQQQLLWSQWLGYGNTQTNWFYVEMTKVIRSLCPLASNIEVKEEYKVYTEDKFYIEDCEFDMFMYNRYGITRIESEDYIEFLNKHATTLPIIYQHSLTDKLFAVDA
jgi:rubrerythrin